MRFYRWICLPCLLILFGCGIPLVILRSEDRLSPQSFLPPPFGLAPWEGTSAANPDERLPDELATELKKAFQELAPDATVKLDGQELTAQFQCQTYYYPKRSSGGTVRQKSVAWLGPSTGGFLLKLQCGEKQYSGQAGPAGSFNPNFRSGAELTDHDWKRRCYEFTLPNDRGYLRLYYCYGIQTDTKLLAGIVAAIQKVYGFEEGDCCVFGTKPPLLPANSEKTEHPTRPSRQAD